MQSNNFTHAFQSTTFTVCEFREGSERLDTYLQALAAKLNSNEEFTPDDTFTTETTFICTHGPGSRDGKRYKPSNAAIHGITKRSIVTIQNDNELCCARAIVTMKTYADAVITKTSKMVIPSKNVWPRNFIDWLVSLKSHVEWLSWKNVRPFYLTIRSKWSLALPRIKSFSSEHPLNGPPRS